MEQDWFSIFVTWLLDISNTVVVSWLEYSATGTSGAKRVINYPYTYTTMCRIADSRVVNTDSTDGVSVRATSTYSYNLSSLTRWVFGGAYSFIIIGY